MSPIFPEVNDVVSYWRDGQWNFSVVVDVPDVSVIVVMPSAAREPLTLKREEVVAVYREVID